MNQERIELDPRRGITPEPLGHVDHNVAPDSDQTTTVDLGAPRSHDHGQRLELGPMRERAEGEAREMAAFNAPLPRSDDGGDAA